MINSIYRLPNLDAEHTKNYIEKLIMDKINYFLTNNQDDSNNFQLLIWL